MRTLKNFINHADDFGRILYMVGNDLEIYKPIKYGDLTPGSNFNFTKNSEGVLELIFANEEYFLELVNFMQLNACVVEVFIYENYDTLLSTEYNKFYFFDYFNFTNDVENNTEERILKFKTFTEEIERKTIIEHNVEYDFETFPIDPDTLEPVIPNDFNLFSFNGTITSLMSEIFNDNIFTPVNRLKGEAHTPDPNRAMKGVGVIALNTSDSITNISLLEPKKSVLEIRSKANDFLKNNGELKVQVIEIKYNQTTKKLDFYFLQNPDINITQDFSQDNYTFFKKEIDFSDDINDVLVESSSNDNIYYRGFQSPPSNLWKSYETIESGNVDETNSTSQMQTTAESIITKRSAIDLTELDIDFTNYEFFKNLHAGQVITLSGYGEFVDGDYIVDQISCIINETHLSFAIDKMEKL